MCRSKATLLIWAFVVMLTCPVALLAIGQTPYVEFT